ncbi:unnamed protein product [Prunus armeniaca]
MVSAISVDLHRFMGPVLRWGDVKEPRLRCLRMEGVFTLAEPRLDWGTMTGVHLLVWLGMLSILGKVTLGALGLSSFPITLQRAVFILQLDVFGMKMFVLLGHLGNPGAEELYFCLVLALRKSRALVLRAWGICANT